MTRRSICGTVEKKIKAALPFGKAALLEVP
jgi:hypothetical protein